MMNEKISRSARNDRGIARFKTLKFISGKFPGITIFAVIAISIVVITIRKRTAN